jgi:hypothetical protein
MAGIEVGRPVATVSLGCLLSSGEITRATRIVLLIANGVWLPLFAYRGASHVYYVATYPTTYDLIFAS